MNIEQAKFCRIDNHEVYHREDDGRYYVFLKFEETQGFLGAEATQDQAFDPMFSDFGTLLEAMSFLCGVSAAAERSGGYCVYEVLTPGEYVSHTESDDDQE